MALSRAAAMRSCFQYMRHTAVGPGFLRSIARRGYASVGRIPNYGGDALWAAGAIAVTIPSCWYLLSNRPHQSHHIQNHDEVQELPNHDEENSEEELKKTSDIPDDKSIKEEEQGKSTYPESKETTHNDCRNDTSSQANVSEKGVGDEEEEATVSENTDDSKSHGENQTDS